MDRRSCVRTVGRGASELTDATESERAGPRQRPAGYGRKPSRNMQRDLSQGVSSRARTKVQRLREDAKVFGPDRRTSPAETNNCLQGTGWEFSPKDTLKLLHPRTTLNSLFSVSFEWYAGRLRFFFVVWPRRNGRLICSRFKTSFSFPKPLRGFPLNWIRGVKPSVSHTCFTFFGWYRNKCRKIETLDNKMHDAAIVFFANGIRALVAC